MRSIEKGLLAVVLVGAVACSDPTFGEPLSQTQSDLQWYIWDVPSIADVTLQEDVPNAGSATTCSARGDQGNLNGMACLIKFDVASNINQPTVQTAWLDVRVTNASPQTYKVWELSIDGIDWTEDEATWSGKKGLIPWNDGPGAKGVTRQRLMATFVVNATGDAIIPIEPAGLAAIQNWLVSPPSRNDGIIIAADATTDGISIATREHSTVDFRPILHVEFTKP